MPVISFSVMHTVTPNHHRLDNLVLLRAIAVTLVCLCHFSFALVRSDSPDTTAFHYLHEYGKYGVQIFFVVSGFVIPLSLHTGGYTIRSYGQFLLKRALRLHPPFLVALALTLVVAELSYYARGVPSPETGRTILMSLFYLHEPADNPVFWTLGVEALYYTFIGLAYPLLVRYPRVAYSGFALLAIVADRSPLGLHTLLFSHLMYFLIGTGGFMVWRQVGDKWLTAGVMAALLTYVFSFHELAASVAALFALGVIFHYQGPVRAPIAFLGEISYSVYLIHFPIGVKLINLASRHLDATYDRMLLVITLAVIIGLATLFYWFVEKPSALWSGRIRYRRALRSAVASEA